MRLPMLVTAVAGGCILLVATSVPGLAAPLAGIAKFLSQQTSGNSLVQQVQRRRGRGGRGGGDAGAAAAGAIIGLGLGAIIASEAARREQGVEYCMRRYRSYNPETGIWIDRRGQPHQCP